MVNVLYLASQSQSRAKLLEQSKIPFKTIEQFADENACCDLKLPFEQLVQSIAVAKMNHAQLPYGKKESDTIFVLTADTMGRDQHGIVHGKPINKDDAINKIKQLRYGTCCTAFCLERKRWHNNNWQTEQQIMKSVTAQYEFHIPDNWIEQYLEEIPYLQISGAIEIEGFGAQFLKVVNGSYSTILGLPLFELREALVKIGFFE